MFFESNNPLKTKHENDSFDPVKRLEIFSHFGAKLINIPYVQPALDKNRKKVDNLFLLSFPQFNVNGDKIPATEIADFLKDLYISLGETEDNKSFKNMVSHLHTIKDKNGEIELEPLVDFLIESSSYKFKKSSVTFDFIEKVDKQTKNKKVSEADKKCPHFSSFETDLFNYQNQKSQENRPLRTVLKKFIQDAILIFPSNYNYNSEGHSHSRKTQSNRIKIKIDLSISHSFIEKSGGKIIHITIAPASDNYFTELDLIKLSTLFGSKQEESSVNTQIRFKINGSGNELNPGELLETIYRHEKKSQFENLSSGIVQIDLNEFESSKEINKLQFFNVFMKNEKQELKNGIKDFSKALCGIILGIFDFERMENDEIFDTILPIVTNNLSFMVLCRGALLKISTDDDFMDSISKNIIVSPYILIANVVLAHNEYILFNLKQEIDNLLAQKSNSKLQELENCQMNARNVLNNQYLNDIFQYPSEKKIVETGNSQRGITNLYDTIIKRLEELSELIEIKKANRTNRSDAMLNALLGFIAALQLKGIFDDLLNKICPDINVYVFTAVFAFAVAGAIFWFFSMKKKQRNYL